VEDVATRVICANQAPDHTTIARFRQRRATALAKLFGEVLALCAESVLVEVGVIAVDGTKVAANAAPQATRDYEQIAREILAEADAVDAEEDERFGDERGDELPPELSTAQGRRGWLREAKRRLDDKRAQEARPIPRDRPDRLKEARRRLEEKHRTECRANAAYEAYRARGRMEDGRRFGRPPDPFQPPPSPTGKINVSDLDSRNVKTSRGWVQGSNAQAVCTEDQIVAAEITREHQPQHHRTEALTPSRPSKRKRPGRLGQCSLVEAPAYSSSVTFSPQLAATWSSSTSLSARWTMKRLGAAPCQWSSSGSKKTRSPGRMTSMGPPRVWQRPTPSVT
jgi:hypothetical protein